MAQLTIQQALDKALRLHQGGELREAEELYRKILALQPGHAEALHYLGVAEHQQGRNDVAIDLIRRAIALRPNYPEAYANLGTALNEVGRTDEAITAHRQAIVLSPGSAQGHFNLGSVLKEKGKIDAAMDEFRQAIALRPGYAKAHCGLGNVLREQGRQDEAIGAYRQAVALDPQFAEAHLGVARILEDKGLYEEALAAYSRAVELRPDAGEVHATRGGVLLTLGRVPEGLAECRRGVELAPNQPITHHALARALRMSGEREQAVSALREALRLEPNSKLIAFELASLTGDTSVPTAPLAHIRGLFDPYSHTFDEHLVNALQYRVPEFLREAVQTMTSRTDLDVLDLGCGTGLCGAQLRPMARRLVGVDLSPRMLEHSGKRGIYDQLIEADVTDVLLRSPGQWDVIVAGDLMIYVGDLSALIPAAAVALKPGGWLAFSIERYDGEGFFLHEARRYSHSLDYIDGLAAPAGLEEMPAREIMVRLEVDVPVPGWIVILRKRET